MKKKRKTYGVKGFMEYQAVIQVGKSKMKVTFSDGTLSAMGVNPARFSTENLMVQHAIENSSEYKRGLIYTVGEIELEGEEEIETGAPSGAQPPGPLKGEPAPLPPEGGACDEEAEWVTEVEFASNDEAKDYLEAGFGLVRSKLRTRDDIVKAGKAHGVEIHFI